MNSVTKSLPLLRVFRRGFSRNAVLNNEVPSPQFARLKEHQKLLEDKGVPVFILKGRSDQLMFTYLFVANAATALWGLSIGVKLIMK